MNASPVSSDMHVVQLHDVSMAFRCIPAGSFRMGSRGEHAREEPRHLVRITEPFYLGIVPVTQAQFQVWTRALGTEHENVFSNEPDHPAEDLDWRQAIAFCAWLNEVHAPAVPAGHVATLPTEAEWEYACRAGTDTEYYTGDGESALSEAGWFAGNSGQTTRPVGAKAPNDLGLFDMHGNVWEWCWDVWDQHAYRTRVDGVADPGAADRRMALEDPHYVESLQRDNRHRVVRGGSWGDVARWCRSASRDGGGPGGRDDVRGFRVCLVPGPMVAQQVQQRLETEPGGTPWRSRRARTPVKTR
jgi:formylglycine-generating enzyme required for sulfatase activity